MNKKISFIAIGLMLLVAAFGQQKITYLDSNWEVTTAELAVYYRPVPDSVKGVYLIKDYFKSGQLQMEGISLSKTEDVFDGLVKWYHPNGKISQTANFANGLNQGEIVYYDDESKELARGIYRDGLPFSGSFYTNLEEYVVLNNYSNGVLLTGNIVDLKGGTKAHMDFSFDQDQSIVKADFYDQKGQFIGMASSYGEYYDVLEGLEVAYNYRPMVVAYTAPKQNGKIVGKKTFFFTDGKVKAIQYYSEPQEDAEQMILGEAYFDHKGQKIDSVTYQDNYPYSGTNYTFFYEAPDEVETIETYVDGQLNGSKKTFYTSGQLYTTAQYVDGYRTGKQITYDSLGTEKFRMIYRDGYEWEGKDESYNQIREFKEGELVSDILLYENGKIQTSTIYGKGGAYETTYYAKTGEKLGVLTVDENYNYLGQEVSISEEGVTQITHYDKGIVVRDICYVNDLVVSDVVADGVSTFTDIDQNNKKYTCTYKDNLPVDGTVLLIDTYTKQATEKTEYKNGLRNGESITYVYDYDLLRNTVASTANYKDDLLDGKETIYFNESPITIKTYSLGVLQGDALFYDKNQQLISTVNYVDDQPQNGVVYEYDYEYNLSSAQPYSNGKLNGEAVFYEYEEPVKKVLYKDGVTLAETTYCNFLADSVLVLEYLDDMPHQGKRVEYENIEEYENGLLTKRSILTTDEVPYISAVETYTDNKKLVTVFYSNGKVKETQTWVDELLEGEVTSYSAQGAKLASGNYLNNKPQSGTFAFFDSYDETVYLILSIKKNVFTATLYNGGIAQSSLTNSVLSSGEAFDTAIDSFMSLISYQYSNVVVYK